VRKIVQISIYDIVFSHIHPRLGSVVQRLPSNALAAIIRLVHDCSRENNYILEKDPSSTKGVYRTPQLNETLLMACRREVKPYGR